MKKDLHFSQIINFNFVVLPSLIVLHLHRSQSEITIKTMTREEVFQTLLDEFADYLQTSDAREEKAIEDKIYSILESAKDVDFKFDLKKNQTFS